MTMVHNLDDIANNISNNNNNIDNCNNNIANDNSASNHFDHYHNIANESFFSDNNSNIDFNTKFFVSEEPLFLVVSSSHPHRQHQQHPAPQQEEAALFPPETIVFSTKTKSKSSIKSINSSSSAKDNQASKSASNSYHCLEQPTSPSSSSKNIINNNNSIIASTSIKLKRKSDNITHSPLNNRSSNQKPISNYFLKKSNSSNLISNSKKSIIMGRVASYTTSTPSSSRHNKVSPNNTADGKQHYHSGGGEKKSSSSSSRRTREHGPGHKNIHPSSTHSSNNRKDKRKSSREKEVGASSAGVSRHVESTLANADMAGGGGGRGATPPSDHPMIISSQVLSHLQIDQPPRPPQVQVASSNIQIISQSAFVPIQAEPSSHSQLQSQVQSQAMVPYDKNNKHASNSPSDAQALRSREDPPDATELRHGSWKSRRGTGMDPEDDFAIHRKKNKNCNKKDNCKEKSGRRAATSASKHGDNKSSSNNKRDELLKSSKHDSKNSKNAKSKSGFRDSFSLHSSDEDSDEEEVDQIIEYNVYNDVDDDNATLNDGYDEPSVEKARSNLNLNRGLNTSDDLLLLMDATMTGNGDGPPSPTSIASVGELGDSMNLKSLELMNTNHNNHRGGSNHNNSSGLGVSQLTFRGQDPPEAGRGRDPFPHDPPSDADGNTYGKSGRRARGGDASKSIQKALDAKRKSKKKASASATVKTDKEGANDSTAVEVKNQEEEEKGAKSKKSVKKKKEIKGILKKKAVPPPIAYFGGTFNDVPSGIGSNSSSEEDNAIDRDYDDDDNVEVIDFTDKNDEDNDDDHDDEEAKDATANKKKKKKKKPESNSKTKSKHSSSSKQVKSSSSKKSKQCKSKIDDGNDGDDESVGVRSVNTKSGLRKGRFAAANDAAAAKNKIKSTSFGDDDEDEGGDFDEDFTDIDDDDNDCGDDHAKPDKDEDDDDDDDDDDDNNSLSRGTSNGSSSNKKTNQFDEGASTLFEINSSAYDDPPEPEPEKFDRSRSHFLRTADLGMTQDTIFAQQFLESPTDIPEPHYHHPTPHPPPGVQFSSDENWISVDDGKGGHSPIAPQAVDALINMGYRVATDPVMWTPTVKTRKFMTEKRLRFDDIPIPGPLEEGEGGPGDVDCLLWSGKFSHKKYHGHELPVIRSQGIVNMCAEELVDLLMDSKRVNEYNPSSIGRNDDLILSDGKKEHCPFSGQRKKKLTGVVIDGARIVNGTALMDDDQSEFTRESECEEIVFDDDGNRSVRSYSTESSRVKKVSQFVGVTKLVRTTNRLPLIRKRLQFVTMLHCRALSDDQGGDGYIVVGRAVVPAEDAEKGHRVMKSEILLSVHIIRRLGGNKKSVGSSGNSVVSSSSGKKASKSDLANRCLMINVTHIKSPMIPNIIAKKVGLSAAQNFLADIRNLAK